MLRQLRKGETIGIIALGSPADPALVARGVAAIQNLGFSVTSPLDPSQLWDVPDVEHFGSAPVEMRVEALEALIDNPDVAAIIAVRGGYGTIELLPHLDFDRIKQAGKAIIGYSDITALNLACFSETGLSTIHGPTVAKEFAEYDSSPAAVESVTTLLRLLQDPDFRLSLKGHVLQDGFGEGPLVGGNLSIITALIGTPWDASFDGAILVLEDVAEPPYKVHRMMKQLYLSGKLDRLQGLVFGRFVNCTGGAGPQIEQVFSLVVNDMVVNKAMPVIKGAEIGHFGPNIPFPVGCRARLTGQELITLESPLARA